MVARWGANKNWFHVRAVWSFAIIHFPCSSHVTCDRALGRYAESRTCVRARMFSGRAVDRDSQIFRRSSVCGATAVFRNPVSRGPRDRLVGPWRKRRSGTGGGGWVCGRGRRAGERRAATWPAGAARDWPRPRVAFPPDPLFLARLFPPPPSDGFRDGRLAERLRIVPDVAMFSFDLRSFRSSSYKPLHFYTDCWESK